MLVTPPFGASSNIALWRAYSKPPVELVVADLVFARKNNPMDIESIDKKCEDTDISIIRNEIELFFEDKAKLFVFKDQYFYLEGKASEPLDYVEKAIIQTKSFWILFGLGAEGYAECERAFCVRGILELCADEKYRKFLCKRIPEVEDLSLYEEVLEKLRTIRKAQMTERLEAMKKM